MSTQELSLAPKWLVALNSKGGEIGGGKQLRSAPIDAMVCDAEPISFEEAKAWGEKYGFKVGPMQMFAKMYGRLPGAFEMHAMKIMGSGFFDAVIEAQNTDAAKRKELYHAYDVLRCTDRPHKYDIVAANMGGTLDDVYKAANSISVWNMKVVYSKPNLTDAFMRDIARGIYR